ncbi:hypothetical protein BJ912DRAFT_1064206 [Pholiota molesta]|nr:hypothetical protein BJ912DRAFT_1064206 [Pholiota molesta]
MAFTNTTVLSVPMPLAPASLTHAIAFLTRPLLPSLAPSTLALLQSALRHTLAAAYVPNRASRLVLAFGGPGAPPPRPVAAACRAAGVSWAAFMPLLSTSAFALVIEPRVVSVAYPASASGLVPAQSVVVWSEAAAVPRRLAPLSTSAHTATVDEDTEPHVRISKARVQAASLRATLHSALARSQTRSTTLAQRLLAVEEEQEADELFAMLSTSVLSPTPTRDAFPASIAAASPIFPYSSAGEEQAEAGSPGSSRSSTPSSFGSAYDSDAESLTSASSASSFDFLDSTKPSSAVATTLPVPTPTTTTRPVPAFARRVPAFARRVPAAAPPAFVPRPSASTTPSALTPAAPARVWIDSSKKDVTKYLYQGGVSTVLTGGVMLGGGGGARKGAAAPRAAATITPKPQPNAVAAAILKPQHSAVAAAILKPQSNAAAAAPKPTARAEEAPKYRAPIGSGRWGAPVHRFSAVTGKDAVGAGAGAGSWRHV